MRQAPKGEIKSVITGARDFPQTTRAITRQWDWVDGHPAKVHVAPLEKMSHLVTVFATAVSNAR